MTDEQKGARLANLWDKALADGMSESERLIYRSNLLGSDKRITNYGGGNTSAKIIEKDPLTGQAAEVMWVKGSGGDVGTIKRDGFAVYRRNCTSFILCGACRCGRNHDGIANLPTKRYSFQPQCLGTGEGRPGERSV